MPALNGFIRLVTAKSILLLVCFVSFFSCQTAPSKVSAVLRQAEAIMEAQPDSAWHLLQRIPSPEKLDGKLQADYALLMTQARDKNDQHLVSSDSLISIAMDYYNRRGKDRVKRANTLYYYARVQSDAGEEGEALPLFLEVKRLLADTEEYKMLGLVMGDLAQINRNQSLYDEAIANSKESVRYYRLANDPLNVAYVYQSIAQIFILRQCMDSVSWYTEQSLLLLDKNPVCLRVGAAKLRGTLYCNQKKYAQAEATLLDVIALDPNRKNIYCHYLSLGRLYQLMCHDAKAYHYFHLCLNSTDLLTRSDANQRLSEVAKSARNFEQALLYKEQADSLRSLARNEQSIALTATLQKKYQNDQLRRENLEITFAKRTQHLAYHLILIVTVLGGYYYYRKYRVENKQKQRILNSIKRNEEEIAVCQVRIGKLIQQKQVIEATLDAKTVEVEQNKGLLAKYESEQKKQEKENEWIVIKIKELENRAEILNAKNGLLQKSVQLDAVSLLDSLKAGTLISPRMDTSEWDLIFSFADYAHGNCVSRLKAAYPQLTKLDLRLSVLLIFGFTTSQLVIVFDWSDENSLFKAKSRLKERLRLTSDESLGEHLQKFVH